MLRLPALLVFLLATLSLRAQLYMPRNVHAAYNKQTRSFDGRPGARYWQNTGRYNITLTANPPDRNVSGSEKIVYVNNSPDTLPVLVIRLILNIHKPGSIRNGDVTDDYLTTGVHIDRFTIDGHESFWNDGAGNNTWKAARLAKPLLPHDSVQLGFDWHYPISVQSNREGMIDSTTYFFAYFYPRVSVFDDYHGWDIIDFTDQQEFYNDFNDYTLTVNAPDNFVVWSTGTLQNPREVLQPAVADRLQESMRSDSIFHMATLADMLAHHVTAHHPMNSWKWTASDISDMTVAISDHFAWDASSVVVDDAIQRRASVQSAYNDTARDFHRMVEFGRHSLDWLSHHWPGVPYPFPKTTIVQGFADMEYPMMVNDGTNADPIFSRFVVEHEIAHTWFPFYMGINESRYAFMDEGWATTFELLIGRDDNGVQKADDFYKQFRINGWINDPSDEEDLPIITPENVLKNSAYGNNAYGKASIGYLAMKDMLGDDLFRKCLHAFMDRWHGKHPIPWDFFYTFNDVSGMDLNWFWNAWYFSNNYIDFGIQGVSNTRQGYAVTINNIGGYPAPMDVVVQYTDNTSETLHQAPVLWKADLKQAVVNIVTKKTVRSVSLNGGIFMDADETNNSWTAP